MVGTLSMAMMAASAVISFLFPIILLIYFRRRDKISYRVVLLGMTTFILFSQILEKVLHLAVIKNNVFPDPLIFAVYGALAAGVFEEVGRFILMKFFMKEHLEWKDGIAFGLGHGGIEAVLIGVMANVQYMVFSVLINNGTFDETLIAQSGNNPAVLDAMSRLKNLLLNSQPLLFALGGIERIFALTLQIGFSILVLYAIRSRKTIFLIYAILIHSFIDFFPALYQSEKLNIIQTE